jgi:hypothetical protein
MVENDRVWSYTNIAAMSIATTPTTTHRPILTAPALSGGGSTGKNPII